MSQRNHIRYCLTKEFSHEEQCDYQKIIGIAFTAVDLQLTIKRRPTKAIMPTPNKVNFITTACDCEWQAKQIRTAAEGLMTWIQKTSNIQETVRTIIWRIQSNESRISAKFLPDFPGTERHHPAVSLLYAQRNTCECDRIGRTRSIKPQPKPYEVRIVLWWIAQERIPFTYTMKFKISQTGAFGTEWHQKQRSLRPSSFRRILN